MHKFAKISQIVVLTVFVFLVVTGCQLNPVSNKLKRLDEKIGESFNKFQQGQQDKVINFMDRGKAEDEAQMGLTKEQKKKPEKVLIVLIIF